MVDVHRRRRQGRRAARVKSCGSLSPDGRYAVGTKYRSDSDSRIDVIVVDLKTGAQTNLTNGTFGGYNAYPTWSPTGEWIVWGSNKDRSGATGFGATDLWRIRPDGTGAQKIVDGARSAARTSSSPTSSPPAAWRPTPSRPARSCGPSRAPAARVHRHRGRGGPARRPRLQARRGRRGDRRLRVGPRRRRRLRRRRRRPAARDVPRRGHVLRRGPGHRRRRPHRHGDRRRHGRQRGARDLRRARQRRRARDVHRDGHDAGIQDVQTATIDWGDGSPAETVPVVARRRRLPRLGRHAGAGRDGEADRRATATAARPTATAARVLAPANARPTPPTPPRRRAPGETVDVDLPATDPEGDRLELRDRRGPAHGRVSMRALDPLAPEQPEVTYVAGAEYTGEDAFTYRVSDGSGSSRTATVKVAVAPLPAARAAGPTPSRSPSARARGARRARPARPRPRGHQADRPATPSRTPRARSRASGAPPPPPSQIVQLPSSKRCVSRRKFRIRVKRIKARAPTSGSR